MALGNLQSDGEKWLYRQGELVLGPVGASELEEMLFAGSLHGQSEIAPLGSNSFRRIGEVDLFRVTVAKAEAKLRVEAAARTEAEQRRRQRLRRLALVGAAAGVAALGAAGAARYLAIHASLGSGEGEALITMEPPIISLARASGGVGEELVAYGETPRPAPSSGSAPTAVAEAGATNPASRATSRTRRGSGETPARPSAPRMGVAEGDGLQTGAFDQAAINGVVSRYQKGLYPCLELVARKNPGAPTRVPIEFVIGNDGRVAQVWVDHADFKTGELPACLLRELQKWPFKPYEGERATVNLAFTVGSKG